jgi:hypothetical protein
VRVKIAGVNSTSLTTVVVDADISSDDSSSDKNANFLVGMSLERETHVPKSPLWSLIKDLLKSGDEKEWRPQKMDK